MQIEQSPSDNEMLYVSKWLRYEELMKKIFLKNQKCESGGRFKVRIHILFYSDKLWTVEIRQISFAQ